MKLVYLKSPTKQLLLAILLLLVLFTLGLPVHAAEKSASFDHFSTGFPLTGQHEFLDCSSCHVAGQFKGLPLDCGLCHNGGRAPGKHAGHFRSSNTCDDCHTVNSWKGARFDHGDVQGECLSCHNNNVVSGKSPSHILSAASCEDCHNTITFDRVGRVDHAAVIGSCNACHNGVIATGKHPGHLPTIAQCDDCHLNTTTWLGSIVDHSQFTGICSSCHNGSIATGKNTTHFVTTLDCDTCHSSTRWIPMLTTFTHDSPDYPGDHRSGVLCVDCHTTNNQTVVWPFTAYRPDCAACHAGDYKQDSHKGVDDIPLPISEVQDCSGSCHLKDGIKSNEHRASGGEW